MTPPLRELWQQQPKESSVAFGAFLIYRDMPANERSLVRVASDYGRHRTLIEGWSSRWFWVERVKAYTAFLDAEHRRKLIAERAVMGERQAAEAQVIQRVLFAPVRALAVKLADLIDREELDHLSVGDLYILSMASARLWPAVARAEREARGGHVPEYVPPDETPDAAGAGAVLDEGFLAEVYLALEQAGLSPRQIGSGAIDVAPSADD